jgi:glycosyltransferase involved in cell wall biosynthesis
MIPASRVISCLPVYAGPFDVASSRPGRRERRRALLVSHVFPPLVAGGAARMGQFARLLPDQGWDVTVLTADHAASVALDRESESEIAARATIVRAPSPASRLIKRGAPVAKRGLAGLVRKVARTAAVSVVFPDREVFWVPRAVRAGRDALRSMQHDIVLATYGPASNLLVGFSLAKTFGLPLVVDFRDLWSTLPMPVFASPLHRAAAHRLERAIVRKSSRLLAVAPAMAADLADTHGIEHARAISITNGFDPLDAARARDAKRTGPFRLMYTGTVHVHYDLEPFWRALRALADAGGVSPASLRVEFVGNLSPAEPQRHGLADFVEISAFVPRAQVFDALARADALLVVETPGYYARNGYAAKVFDYVLTGKPVVGLVDPGSNTETLLRAAGLGHCVAPDDSAGLQRVLHELIAAGRQSPRSVNPDIPPLSAFNRRHLVAELARVLDDVVETEPRGRW